MLKRTPAKDLFNTSIDPRDVFLGTTHEDELKLEAAFKDWEEGSPEKFDYALAVDIVRLVDQIRKDHVRWDEEVGFSLSATLSIGNQPIASFELSPSALYEEFCEHFDFDQAFHYPYWTIEEAAAHAVGASAAIFDLCDYASSLPRRSHIHPNPIQTNRKLIAHLNRALEVGQIEMRFSPDEFFTWVSGSGFDLHPGFIAVGQARAQNVQQDQATEVSVDRPLGNKERRNLDRLIYTMAIKGYDWKPADRGKTKLSEQLELEMEEVLGPDQKLSARAIRGLLDRAHDVASDND